MRPQGRFDVGFVCVPTESAGDGSCDVSAVEGTVERLKGSVDALVIKSAFRPASRGACGVRRGRAWSRARNTMG
jgi:UDP-glucose 6-dehydrogenase